jgi:SAM-dependent methyltransferase
MSSDWDDLAQWWLLDIQDDPAYASDVHPILLELTSGTVGVAMDLGCGEGQGMRLMGANTFGCDLSQTLLRRAEAHGRVVRATLPDLGWLRDESLDTAFSVYLLDLIVDYHGFFADTARVVKPGGTLAIVINHPTYTAPGSCPMLDLDNEMLWRWGSYFKEGSSTEPAGSGLVEFFHRPMGALLTSAAEQGWMLDRMVERGLSDETVEHMPAYEGQEDIPRLLGVRWKRTTE